MRIARLFRRAAADRDQLEQTESYLQIETDENIAHGMPADEALAAARRKFGNSVLIREEIYRMNSVFFSTHLLAMCAMDGAHCAAIRYSRQRSC